MEEQQSENPGFLKFILSKKFFIQFGIAAIILAVLFIILGFYLRVYTKHGNEQPLPEFYGFTLEELDSIGYTERYDFFVIDSVYDVDNRKGAIVIQNPLPGSQVKEGRNVYFTIVASTPEIVTMPDLHDLTVRQAINILAAHKLKTGKLMYTPSFDKNAVLEQFYMGDTVFEGDTLEKGALIDLLIGSGERNYKIPVPFLLGLTRQEAIYELNVASFNLGNEFYMDSIQDEFARVYMQEPMWDTDLPHFPGDSVHLWYKSDTAFDFDSYLKTFLPDSLQMDSLNTDSLFEY